MLQPALNPSPLWKPEPTLEGASSILHINLDAIAANYKILQQHANGAEVSAVVKANAYAVGLERVMPTLRRAGCNWFFIADITEGIHARSIDQALQIGVLGGLPKNTEEYFVQHNLVPVLNTMDDIARWSQTAAAHQKSLPAIIHIDTGMNRLGLSTKDVTTLQQNKNLLNGLDIKFWFSHLIFDDKTAPERTRAQYDQFVAALSHLPQSKAAICNGAALFHYPYLTMDMIRAGKVLYGANPTAGKHNPMQPVFEWYARILEINEAHIGDTIGYSATHILKRKTRYATLGIGYADGLTRGGSDKASVFIGGHRAPVMGRISMDLTTVDVTDIPDAALNSHPWVEIMGPHISLDELSESCNTIPHEILTKLPFRIHRVYSES